MSENIPYIIAEDGYYYVAYKEKAKVPEVVVSAKGVANGLSEEYNDGWDFGPDSYDPNSTANPPYTQTSGIQEALDYIAQFWQIFQGSAMPELHLLNQRYSIYTDLVFPPVTNAQISTWSIVGQGRFNSEITLENGCVNGLDYSNLQPYQGSGANITLRGFTIRANASNITTHVNAVLPTGSGNNEFTWDDMQIAGNSTYGVDVGNIQEVTIGYTDNAYVNSSSGYFTFEGVIDTVNMYNQSAFGTISVNCSTLNRFSFRSIFSDVAIIFNQPVNIVELEGENHNQITYQGSANMKMIKLHNYIFISPTISSPFYVNTGYTPYVIVDGFVYNIPSGTVDFFDLGSSGVQPNYISIKNVLNVGTGTITIPSSTPATPSVPASATAQQNTNPYPVKIYVNGGALTEIQVTINGTAYTVYSNSTASAVYEGFTLPAGASITLTYSTAPTWSWVPE